MKSLKRSVMSLAIALILCVNLALPHASFGAAVDTDSSKKFVVNSDPLNYALNWVAGLSDGRTGVITQEGSTYYYRMYDHDGYLLETVDLSSIMGSRASTQPTLKALGLANGRSLITWEGVSGGCALGTNNMFQFVILESDGSVYKSITDISTEISQYNCFSYMTELSDGKIAFMWMHDSNQYMMRIFNADGTSFSVPSGIESTGSREDELSIGINANPNFTLTSNKNGTFMVVYSVSANDKYYAVLYNNDGTQKTVNGFNHFIVAESNHSSNRYVTADALSNGNFLIKYDFGAAYRVKIIGPDGTTVSTITDIDPFIYGDNYSTFLSLNNGGFIVMDSSGAEVKVKEFDNTGATVTEWRLPDTEQSAYSYLLFKGYDQGIMAYNYETGKLSLHNVYQSAVSTISDFANTAKTSTTASFSWTAASGATNVAIEQSPSGLNDWTTATTGTVSVAATSATVTGLTASTEYDFRLVVTGGTNAGNSNVATLTTDAAAACIVTFNSADPDLDYSQQSITRTVCDTEFTFSVDMAATGLAFDADGLYALDGQLNGSDIRFMIRIEDGYSFDLSGLKAQSETGSFKIDTVSANNTIDSIENIGANSSSLQPVTTNLPIDDVKQITIAADLYAIFQDFEFTDIKPLAAQTDAEAVAAAKVSVAVGYNGSDSASSVTQNVTLSTTGTNGTSVAWSSDKPGVIATNGTVTRPSFAESDATVTLTATITKGSESDTKTFTLTVIKQSQTDAEAVAAAKGNVAVGYNGSDTASSVTQNVTLSTTGTNGTSVAWSSDKPGVIATNGTVTRPSFAEGDATVTLTATITKGSESDTKTFTLTVIKQSQTDAEAVAAAKGNVAVGYNGSDSASSVTQNVTLSTTGTNGTSVAWSSDKPGVIATNGTVTRPSFADGDATVTLTATITKGSESDTKTFTLTVIKQSQTDAEAVAAAKGSVAVGYNGSDSASSVTQNVTLSTTGTNGTSVAWSSDKPGVIATNGTVTRPSFADGDATVTLTATITKGSESDTKTFTLTVIKQSQTDAEAVAAAKGSVAVGYNGSDTASSVTQNVTLSTTGTNGTSVAWSSDKPGVIATNGTVTRPSFADGDATVTLTATITKGSESDTKTFTLTVRALPAPPPTNSSNPPSESKPDQVVEVLVNGKIENAGTAKTEQVNNQSVTTVLVDQQKLEDKLAQEGVGATVTIPFKGNSDVVVGELNGQMVKNMENKQAVLQIRTEQATYTLPAVQINIGSISDQIGQSVALQDIKVKIEIASPTAETIKVVENAAAKGTFTLVVPPVDFNVKATYGDASVQVSKFNAYVERTIAIPDGVDPNKITTAVVVDTDGAVRHVPTKVILIDGKYYAKVNSLTNSTYSVIWHPLEFTDVAHHWAKQAINDMGSRMVIHGTGDDKFSPEQDITRAEFAAIIVRGLGLKLESGISPFKDIEASDWYNDAINTAYSYQLISGFGDGTFRPNDRITREEAMLIISKAIKITGLKAKLSAAAPVDQLQSFTDMSDASAWALQGISDSVQAGIISGRNGNKLAPHAFVTRAEVAAMIQRMLQQSALI